MYVHVTPKGAVSFRLDYRLNGRRETVYLGKYGTFRRVARPSAREMHRCPEGDCGRHLAGYREAA